MRVAIVSSKKKKEVEQQFAFAFGPNDDVIRSMGVPILGVCYHA
jgi:hypothetical protein